MRHIRYLVEGMLLESLRVLHLHKSSTLPESALPDSERLAAMGLSATSLMGGFYLATCQRTLWICTAQSLRGLSDSGAALANMSVLKGVHAYAFLLRVATGLESQVIGETDIFGQFKEAWRKSSAQLDEKVNYWVQKIFEDTKEIRSRHLEHLGGVSYGSLVRKLLKERAAQEPVLLIGAGQLALSVAPFLGEIANGAVASGREVWLWNRNAEKAHVLAADVMREFGVRIRVLETAEEEALGWQKAQTAVVCIPVDAADDARRIESWELGKRGEKSSRTLLHLGVQRAQAGAWQRTSGALFLDDIFEIQRAQGEVRSLQIGLAIRACEERAKLRALGNSVSIHHGWEDLAVFA